MTAETVVPDRSPGNPTDREINAAQPVGRTRSIIRSNALWRNINVKLHDRLVLGGIDEDGEKQPDQYDPVVELAVMGMDRKQEPSIRVACHKAVASYLYPTLHSVEVKNDDEPAKKSAELNMKLLEMLDKHLPPSVTPTVVEGSSVTVEQAKPSEHGGHD